MKTAAPNRKHGRSPVLRKEQRAATGEEGEGHSMSMDQTEKAQEPTVESLVQGTTMIITKGYLYGTKP